MNDEGCDALAADGTIVHLRPVRVEDRPQLAAMFVGASDRSRHLRFGSLGERPISDEVARLTRAPAGDHHVEVASHRGKVIAVASYERLDDPRAGDFAAFVAEDWQGRGVGTLLLERITDQARRAGVTDLVGDVLPDNQRMLRVAAGLAPGSTVTRDQDTALVRLSTAPDAAAIAAIDSRERTAERLSLRPLLAPAVVAVVGAGRAAGGVGHEVLRNIGEHGFTGRLYAVNPHANDIGGYPCYPRVGDIPDQVDMVVVAVPAAGVPAVLADAGAAGARGAVILSAGFAETGPTGAALQQQMLAVAREQGIRLIGPNCLGVANTDPSVRLDATFTAAGLPPAGALAVASQSGAVGIAVLAHAARAGVGVSTFVSLGNKADVSGNDMLAYWYDDPYTDAVALYLESFGNPRKFARLARAVARRKPVLAVKAGRSAVGQRAVGSHTAAAASPDVAVDSLFAQAGVIRVDTLGELLDASRMLVGQPLPTGPRLGVVGNAGGLCVLAADAAGADGLQLPELAAGNPLDLGAGATPGALASAVSAMARGGLVDAVVVVVVATAANDAAQMIADVAGAADGAPQTPVAVVAVGLANAPASVGTRNVPVYALPEQAVRAVAHAARYASWRHRPLGGQPRLPDIDAAHARKVVNRAIEGGGGWQPWTVAAEVLGSYGITVPEAIEAAGQADAVAAAERLGYPVAVKAADPQLVHKSDISAVVLDLGDAAAVSAAYRQVAAVAGELALVQRMVHRGVELVVGVVHDQLFGPLLMAGLGGVYTDLLGDRAFALLPVTDTDAAALWRRLRCAPLLTGYRGAPAVDTAAVEQLLLRIGRLAEDLPEVAELDLNPVFAGPDGTTVADVKLRLAQPGPHPDPWQRRLRPTG